MPAGPAVSVPLEVAAPAAVTASWSLPRRVVFRFVFGYLVLYNVPFPLNVIPVRGDAVLDGVAQSLTGNLEDMTGAGQFSVASTGALALVRAAAGPWPDANLVAVDRQGHVWRLNAPTRSYSWHGPPRHRGRAGTRSCGGSRPTGAENERRRQ
jgi:hypothetical protein